MEALTHWQWGLLMLGAFLTGMGKGGLPGIGNITIVLFAMVFPAKSSVGILLPVLISADLVAVMVYKRHAVWKHLWPLFPWTALGVASGWFFLGKVDDSVVAKSIGGILIVMTALHLWRKYKLAGREEALPNSWWLVVLTGVLAGFTTMIANGAGPVMMLFFLAIGLPKMEFIGTGAWFFMLLNWFKVPFGWNLGIISMDTLAIDLWLFPFAMVGVLLARYLIKWVPQKLFEALIWIFTVLASVRLLVK